MKAKTSTQKRSWTMLAALTLACAAAGALVWSPGGHPHAQQRRDRQLTQGPAQQPNAARNRRIALVIGNGAYQNANPLKNPPNDAKAIADALRELGFEVTLGVNKPQREMKQMMREFGQRLRTQGGVGLFYYAGHGVQAKGHNYLIPVAAVIQSEADLEDEAIDVNYVLNLMDEAQNALNIVILDACRNNPFGRSFRSAQNGLAQVKAPTGTLIAYATAPDDIAADGGGENSPYTEELIKEMRLPGVLVETMFRRVAEQVSSRSGGRQEPWFSANVKGDFYFSVTLGVGAANANTTNPTTGPASISEAAKEEALWEAVKDSNDAQDFKDYLAKYPNGAYAAAAQVKLRRLEGSKNSASPSTTNPGSTNSSSSNMARTRTNQTGIEFVLLPAGSFMMGSTNGGDNEKPVHQVTISQAFYMGKYEVTQGQWQSVMGNNRSHFKDCGGNCPVDEVSWDDAQNFINKLNESNDGFKYRLPTEAEWEYACRAGTTTDFSFGNSLSSDQANFDGNYPYGGAAKGVYRGKTTAVGSFAPNAFGLYDMHGNVGEWCEDWYHPNYDGAPTDGSAWLSGGKQNRVLRGGSWFVFATGLRSAARYPGSPGGGSVGFRVVAMLRTP